MIIDKLENVARYRGISPQLDRAIAFMANAQFSNMELGKTIVEPDQLTCVIIDRELNKQLDFWEAHELFADIHVVIDGEEIIRYTAENKMPIKKPYSEDGDTVLFEDKSTSFTAHWMAPGHFMILFPKEVHQPNGPAYEGCRAKKAIIKVRM